MPAPYPQEFREDVVRVARNREPGQKLSVIAKDFELRKHVFDLITEPDDGRARQSVRAVPFDSEDAGDLRVVFGIGQFTESEVDDISSIGLRGIGREEITEDLLGTGKRKLDPEAILKVTLPEILRGAPGTYLPVWKYMNEAGRISETGAVDESGLAANVIALLARTPNAKPQSKSRFASQYQAALTTPSDVFDSDLALYFKYDALLCLNPAAFNLDDLRTLLAQQYANIGPLEQPLRTSLYKAISHYDRLQWRSVGDAS